MIHLARPDLDDLPLGQAVFAVAILMLAMLVLSYARTARWKFLRSRDALAKP